MEASSLSSQIAQFSSKSVNIPFTTSRHSLSQVPAPARKPTFKLYSNLKLKRNGNRNGTKTRSQGGPASPWLLGSWLLGCPRKLDISATWSPVSLKTSLTPHFPATRHTWRPDTGALALNSGRLVVPPLRDQAHSQRCQLVDIGMLQLPRLVFHLQPVVVA